MRAKTILVVDDDEDIRKILAKLLGAQGFHVLSAEGPDEARTLLSQVPHVILTDLHMEPVDGFQFIRDLRGNPATKKTPLLVLSALNDFPSVKKAIALGVNDYILKPVVAPLLIRKIKKVLFHQDFLHWDAPPGEEIDGEIVVDAKITSLGETGYQITGPFKLTPEKDLIVEAADFQQMELSRFPQRASQLMKTYQKDGKFQNDITFIGIDEAGSSGIRLYIRKRSQG